MAEGKMKQAVSAAEAYSEPASSKNRTEKALKPKAKVVKKSMHKNLTNIKKLQGTPQVQGKKNKIVAVGSRGNSEKQDEKELNLREVKQKSIASDGHKDKRQQIYKNKEKLGGSQMKQKNQKNSEEHSSLDLENHKSQMIKEKHADLEKNLQKEKEKEKLGGLIFMCSAKTKPDCFSYRVMGLPISRKELVLGVKPGLTLFLYDFDLKLLYGIYKASSSGGVKLEPAAFNGAFPLQVRFTVHQDCYPLPESIFKKAIKENCNERRSIDIELTVKQVQKLVELFRPVEVFSKAPAISPQLVVGIQGMEPYAGDPHKYEEFTQYSALPRENDQNLANREVPSRAKEEFRQHTFIGEREYRSHGLRVERPNPPPPSYIAPVVEPYPRGLVSDHLLRHPPAMYRDIAALQGEHIRQDQLSLNQREYQTYGLGARRELHHPIPTVTVTAGSTLDSYPNHLHSSSHYGSSMLDPYQLPKRRDEVPSGSYYHKGTEPTETYPIESVSLQRREAHLAETDHLGRRASYLTECDMLRRRENDDMERMHSTYASNTLSNYNRTGNYQEARPEPSLAPVSSRYSFAGPSRLYG